VIPSMPSQTNLRETSNQGVVVPPMPLSSAAPFFSDIAKGPTFRAQARTQSAPLVAADCARDYVEVCHRVNQSSDAQMGRTSSDPFHMMEGTMQTNGMRNLVPGPSDASAFSRPASAAADTVSASTAAPSHPRPTTRDSSRPGTRGSRESGTGRNSSKRGLLAGMPLGAKAVPLNLGKPSPGDNLFGVVSRSRSFAQGSPTELGVALASPAQSVKSRPSPAMRSHSAAGARKISSSETPARGLGALTGLQAAQTAPVGEMNCAVD